MTRDEAIERVARAIEGACMTHLGRDIGTIHRHDIAAAAVDEFVAMVPERMPDSSSSYLLGWNDCIDEIERLSK